MFTADRVLRAHDRVVSVDHETLEHHELANFRDVAPPGSPMARWVRTGVLWRSDAPHPGDAEPSFVREHDELTWPPPVVVDLRQPGEAGVPHHPLAAPGVRVVSLPLTGSLSPDEQVRLHRGGVTLAQLYRRLLDAAPVWFPELVSAAASTDGPVLIHCAAGKDRTGVAVALLLAVAGVPRTKITADYLATREALPRVRARLNYDAAKMAAFGHLLDVSLPAITDVLDELDPDPVAFAHRRGVDPTDLERWQRRVRPVSST